MIKKRSKFGNKKIAIDGIKFDSIKEGRRYGTLKLLKKAGEIKDFIIQAPFKYYINGKFIFTYNADFLVLHNDGSWEVEDVKGICRKTGKAVTTSTFNLKKRIIEEYYQIKIKII